MTRFKYFTFVAIMFYFSGISQISDGNWLVGGEGNYKFSNTATRDGHKIASGSGFIFRPSIGYFLWDKFAAGIQLQIGRSKTDGGISQVGYGGGPFIRYYLLKSEAPINVLVETSYIYSENHVRHQDIYHQRSFALSAGPAIFFNNSVALEITGNYETTNDHTTIYDRIYIALGFQIHLD